MGTIYTQIAKKTNLSEDEVRAIVNQYFTETRKAISYGDRPIIRLPNFGSFIVKARRLNAYIKWRSGYFRENREMYDQKNKDKLSSLWTLRDKWIVYKRQKRKQYNPNKHEH